ncbi:hypothetical protein AMEX_G9718 [Astyanax mexicanus]|uniref:Uncharacterized protein n=1 Tax=Astyanax mexicanus TaxID=7994 RepID=A0A8T2LUY3_ASTMX|nr:hypothetical protein AMEX_G9718 [Astyanax mexicanus]
MNKIFYINDRYHWYREGYPGPYLTETKRVLSAPWEKNPEKNHYEATHEQKEENSELDDSLLLSDSEDCSLEDSNLDETLLDDDEDDEEEYGCHQT